MIFKKYNFKNHFTRSKPNWLIDYFAGKNVAAKKIYLC